jgi:hypothetical protein
MDMEMMMQLFAYALGIVLAAGMLFVGYQYLIPFLKAKIGNEQYDELVKKVHDLMLIAEQHFGPKTGAQKKQFVIDELKKMGVKFDEAFVSNMIDGFMVVLENQNLVNTNKENE